MAESITSAVGTSPAANHFPDVETVQSLLNQVPSIQGGPTPLLDLDGIIGPKTIGAIGKFQQHHFGWRDGRVDPKKQTITKLNEFDRDPRAGNPIRFAASNADNGFDATGVTAGSAPWQMVPLSGTKTVRLVNGGGVSSVTSNNSKIAEPRLSGSSVVITGNRIGTTLIKARDASGRVVARLDVTVKRRRTLFTSYHFVKDKTGKRTSRRRSNVDSVFSTINDLLLGLNKIWRNQANIELQLLSVFDPQTYSQHNFGAEVHDTAHLNTRAGRRNDDWNKVTARRNRGANVNVFFVWEFENDLNTATDTADGAADRFQRSCLIEDSLVDDLDVVLGHEIGHLLRLPHVSDGTNLMLNGSGTNGRHLTRGQINRANP